MPNQSVAAMAILRILSGLIEISAAILILRANRIDTALRINGILAVIGPTLLLLGIMIGAAALTDRFSISKILLIYLGALLIFHGTR